MANNLKSRIRIEAVERSKLDFISEADIPGLISDGFDAALLQHLRVEISGEGGHPEVKFTIKMEGLNTCRILERLSADYSLPVKLEEEFTEKTG